MIIGIRLTVDYAFKRVFGHENNIFILIWFLNDILGLTGDNRIVSVKLKNPFSTKDFNADKMNILDIKAQDNLGRWYDIEMQVSICESYPKRILHYACNMYLGQIDSGMPYSRLNPVISINILDGVLFNDNDRYANCFTLRNKENDLILTDDLTFFTFELPKFNYNDKELSEPVQEWLYLIKNIHRVDFDNPPKFKHIPIKEIMEVLKIMSKTTLEYQQYEERIRAQRDLLTIKEDSYNKGKREGIEEGKREGIEEGIEEGNKKAKMETAKKMKNKDLPIELIMELTGLTKDEIDRL